jgi:hypothetical protein
MAITLRTARHPILRSNFCFSTPCSIGWLTGDIYIVFPSFNFWIYVLYELNHFVI